MNNDNNLEELFKNSFEQFEETPSENVWSGVAADRLMKSSNGITDPSAEQAVTSAFNNFESQPTEQVWAGVKKHLINRLYKKRRRRVAAWLFSLLFVVSSGFGLYLYNDNELPLPQEAIATNENSPVAIEEPQAITPQPQINNTTANDAVSESQIGASSAIVEENSGTRAESFPKPLITTSTEIPAIITTTGNSPSSNSSNIAPIKRQKDKPVIATATEILADPVGANYHVKYDLEEQPADYQAPAKNVVKTEEVVSDKKEEASTPNSQDILNSKEASNKESKDAKVMKPAVAEEVKSKKASNYIKYNSTTDLNNNEARFSIKIMGGLDKVWNQIKGGSDVYRELRGIRLPAANSYNFGLGFSYSFNKTWFIQSGVSMISRSFSERYDKKIVKTVTTSSGQDSTFVSYNIDRAVNYGYKGLEIPFLVGVHLGDARLNYHIAAGPTYTLMTATKGEVLAPVSMQPEPFTGNNSSLVKGFNGLLLNAGISYQLLHELSFSIDPTFRYALKSVYDNNYTIKQRPASIGVNLGLTYHID
jgi:hypothetical protein